MLKIYLSRISRIDRYLNDLYVYSILWATFLLWKCIINWMEKYWEVFSIHVSGCEKAVSTVQHDNVAFGFATYLHVKGVANKQEAVGSRVVRREKSIVKKKIWGQGWEGGSEEKKRKEREKRDNVSKCFTQSCKYLYIFMRHVKLNSF